MRGLEFAGFRSRHKYSSTAVNSRVSLEHINRALHTRPIYAIAMAGVLGPPSNRTSKVMI